MSEGTLVLSPQTIRRTPLNAGDAFAILAPAMMFVQLKTIGLLYATDIIFLIAAPVMIARGMRHLTEKPIVKFMILCSLWLLAQVVTDVVRGSASADYLRVWSKIGLTLVHFLVIWLLLRNSVRRVVLFGIGLAVGSVLSTIISPSRFAEDDPWKYGYGVTVSMLCVIGCAGLLRISGSKTLFSGLMCLLSAFNLYMGFRSLAAVCLLTMAFSNFELTFRRLRRRVGRLQLAAGVVILLISAWGLSNAYGYGAQQGWFGHEAQEKFRDQTRGISILLGGRAEIFASSAAIIDSPLLGHGSWAKDPKYSSIMRLRQAEFGYREAYIDPLQGGLIPTHSHIFGAWVEAGIFGALFWGWVLAIIIGALRRLTGREPMLPLFVFLSLQLFWDTLFSPYGADQRFLVSFSIAAILLLDWMSRIIRTCELAEQVQA